MSNSARKIRRRREKLALGVAEKFMRQDGLTSRSMPTLSDWKKHVKVAAAKAREKQRLEREERERSVGGWDD